MKNKITGRESQGACSQDELTLTLYQLVDCLASQGGLFHRVISWNDVG
jgi:hypothetical protein